MVLMAHVSQLPKVPKQYLNPFSHFYRTHESDKQTDQATPSVATGRI